MGLGRFLEDRLGVVSFWRDSMSQKRPPAGIGWLRTIGFVALTILLLQLVSGIALSLHYVPSADLAYDSIRAFEQDVVWGRIVRSFHHHAASAFVVFVVLHMLRVYFTGAYKAPREFTWLTGLGLLLLVIGFGFTGYLLPWDQKAFFATKVGTEIAGKAPYLGAELKQILNGGDDVGPPTLTRFYVIHVVLLPLGLLGLLALHMFLIQRHGVSPPGRPVGDDAPKGPTYFPHHTLKEVIAGAVIVGILFWVAVVEGAPLEAVAEPSDTSYDPRPDWYFLGLFELLKLFEGDLEALGTFWIPSGLLALLALLPFLDRGKERHWKKRPITVGLGVLIVIAASSLTVMGWIDEPENEPTLPYPLGYTHAERHGYLLVRRLKCGECHAYRENAGTPDEIVYGKTDFEAPDLDEIEIEWSIEDLCNILLDPIAELGAAIEMPDYAHVDYEDRRAVALYLKRLYRDRHGDSDD